MLLIITLIVGLVVFIFVYQFILSRNNNLNDTYGYHWCKHAFNAATTIVANIVLSINGLTADAPNGGSAIPTTSLLPMFLMPNHFMTSLKLKCFMEAISWGANNGFSILYMHKVANALYDSKPLKSSYKQLELWIYANKVLNTQLLALFLINCLISIVPLKKNKGDWGFSDHHCWRCLQTNIFHWQILYMGMTKSKDIKVQINEYHKILEDLKTKNITLQEEFTDGFLIENLPYL